MDQLTLLDYICGLSGISRTQAIRRLLNFSRRALAEYGTTLITAPEALGRDYFVRPDSQPPSEFPPVGSSDWAAKCEEELEEFNASLAKRREEEEAVVLDGVAESSGVALIRGGSSSLVAESPPDISSWAPHVLSFDSDNSPEDS